MPEWIVAYCHVNAESKAEIHLKRQGFEVYLPKHKKTRRHARRVETVIRPLFPRYLFVAFDPEITQWRAVHSTIGINSLICTGEMPLTVPHAVIEEIKAHEDKDGLIALGGGHTFNRGEKVKVLSGAFSNCAGLFDCAIDDRRITILLELLGRQTKVHIPVEAICSYA